MDITAVGYDGSSYSTYTSTISMATMAQLTVTARLDSENGILYYFSQYDNGTGNYFLVQFIDSVITLSFSELGEVTVIKYVTNTTVAVVTN